MVKLLKIKRRNFFQLDSIPSLVSRTVKTRKFKLLYFRNETCFGTGNLHKDIFSIYRQPSVNKNSSNLVVLTLQFDDVIVKTINYGRTSQLNQVSFRNKWQNLNVLISQSLSFRPFHCYSRKPLQETKGNNVIYIKRLNYTT